MCGCGVLGVGMWCVQMLGVVFAGVGCSVRMLGVGLVSGEGCDVCGCQ